MNVVGISNTTEPPKYSRLTDTDIARLPSLKINRADFYQGSSSLKAKEASTNALNKEEKQRNKRNKIFTILTFGLVGLYLAHRQNLFNPIKRTAKKIIKSDTLKNKALAFTQENINDKTFKQATLHYLNALSQEKNRPQAFQDSLAALLKDNDALENLYKKVSQQLHDDPDTARLQRGFTVDLMDRLLSKIEKTLKQMKENGQDYKNKATEIIENIFNKPADTNSVATATLYEAINNRSSLFIENFVKDFQH